MLFSSKFSAFENNLLVDRDLISSVCTSDLLNLTFLVFLWAAWRKFHTQSLKTDDSQTTYLLKAIHKIIYRLLI